VFNDHIKIKGTQNAIAKTKIPIKKRTVVLGLLATQKPLFN